MKKRFSFVWIFTSILLLSSAVHAQKAQEYATKNKTVQVFITELGSDSRLKDAGSVTFSASPQPGETDFSVFVDINKKFQTMLGVGGALTDASAETFYKLPEATRNEFLTAYFDKNKGIGYTLGRTNIQSCDFSTDSYSYIKEGDAALKTFDISHDEKYRIPFIKAVTAAAGGKLMLFASPWSPPAFMKDNNNVLHGGKLLAKYDQSWANFFVKFIQAYQASGIPVWGLTVQNEPMATQSWESCKFTATEERDFVKNFLGPTLKKNGLADKKLIVWDHNRDLLYQYASTILEDPEAAKYVWGIGFHWYETWTKAGPQFTNTRLTHEAFPDKNLIFTEGCNERYDAAKVGDWALGERYGESMINDFNAGTVAWTDWNILLDEKGGPNHVGNFCFAPIHADTKTGLLTYTNSYYYIGHFSKFIKVGARRISSSASRDKLLTTAYQNPDGSLAVVVMNKTDEKIDYSLWIQGQAAHISSNPHSIETLLVN